MRITSDCLFGALLQPGADLRGRKWRQLRAYGSGKGALGGSHLIPFTLQRVVAFALLFWRPFNGANGVSCRQYFSFSLSRASRLAAHTWRERDENKCRFATGDKRLLAALASLIRGQSASHDCALSLPVDNWARWRNRSQKQAPATCTAAHLQPISLVYKLRRSRGTINRLPCFCVMVGHMAPASLRERLATPSRSLDQLIFPPSSSLPASQGKH